MKKDMLLDKYLPAYEFNEIHSVVVKAAPESVFAATKSLTPSELSPWVFRLLSIRDLPARLIGKHSPPTNGDQPFLNQLYENDFIPLAEEPDREIVFGMIGQFWKPAGAESPQLTTPQEFLDFDQPAYAKVAANLAVTGLEDGTVCLSTETRIYAPNPQVRKKFALYWRLISMGSGFIRVLWLKAIKRKAERT
jgi:hypothetical protein